MLATAILCGLGLIIIIVLVDFRTKHLIEKYNCLLSQDVPACKTNELEENYLVEFRGDRFNTVSVINSGIFYGDANDDVEPNVKTHSPKIVRITVKPIDVLNELERVPTNWSLEGIDEKIQILKDKEKLIVQHHAKREVSGLLLCLENRKKYNTVAKNGKTYRAYFSAFDTTTDEKIQDLLKKYDLRREPADIFIPEFPKDAIQVMKEYTEIVNELCSKKPLFYVIATPESFKQSYGKRDPILLALSPFGFYYCILGAWDKEMIYLPEL